MFLHFRIGYVQSDTACHFTSSIKHIFSEHFHIFSEQSLPAVNNCPVCSVTMNTVFKLWVVVNSTRPTQSNTSINQSINQDHDYYQQNERNTLRKWDVPCLITLLVKFIALIIMNMNWYMCIPMYNKLNKSYNFLSK